MLIRQFHNRVCLHFHDPLLVAFVQFNLQSLQISLLDGLVLDDLNAWFVTIMLWVSLKNVQQFVYFSSSLAIQRLHLFILLRDFMQLVLQLTNLISFLFDLVVHELHLVD